MHFSLEVVEVVQDIKLSFSLDSGERAKWFERLTVWSCSLQELLLQAKRRCSQGLEAAKAGSPNYRIVQTFTEAIA